MNATEKLFKPVSGTVTFRKGAKEPWWELVVTKADGTQTKMIAKKVKAFFSDSAAAQREEGL